MSHPSIKQSQLGVEPEKHQVSHESPSGESWGQLGQGVSRAGETLWAGRQKYTWILQQEKNTLGFGWWAVSMCGKWVVLRWGCSCWHWAGARNPKHRATTMATEKGSYSWLILFGFYVGFRNHLFSFWAFKVYPLVWYSSVSSASQRETPSLRGPQDLVVQLDIKCS